MTHSTGITTYYYSNYESIGAKVDFWCTSHSLVEVQATYRVKRTPHKLWKTRITTDREDNCSSTTIGGDQNGHEIT